MDFPTMQAAVLTGSGLLLKRNHPVPVDEPDAALVRVRLAGICATDLELLRGYKGGFRGVLGHEFVGEVVQCAAAPEWIGRRVVAEINIGCGHCSRCRSGLGKHCRQRKVLGIWKRDGAFADYLTVPIANLHPVPDELSDESAVFTEPLAAAFEVLEQVPVTASTRVYVQGDGRLGLLCAMVMATTGCDLTLIGRNPNKLALLRNPGICDVVLADEVSLLPLLKEPADLVIEVTGGASGFETALQLVRPMGTVVLKSTFADSLRDFDSSRLVVDEITVVGSRCGPFDKALAALATKVIDPLPLVHARYPLGEAHAAFAYAGSKGVLKVLLTP